MKYLVLIGAFLLTTTGLQAQSFYDEATIQTIEITFAQSNWDFLLDQEAATTDGYIMATSVAINGTVFDSVGVKYKGNSTYSPSQVKNPFHIELDTYKNQDYQGYTDIKLSNVKNDPSFVREVLSYKIARQYMDAPLSNYANVTVNGVLIGLYTSSESITKKFTDAHFNSKNNAFVKCNPPAGAGPGSSNFPNLVYQGTDSSLYYAAYELKSTYGWKDLTDLCDTLSNYTSVVNEILDVDRALWMLAYDNVLVNLDSYIGAFAQNYYLYRDDYKRFIPIVWDMNESFGRFSMTGTINLPTTASKQQLTHLLHVSDANYPLVSKLLSNPLYKRMYLAHFKTILLENFDNNAYFTVAQGYQTTISQAVQNDPNKFYTYANFTDNLNLDVTSGGGPGGGTAPGITNLMNARNTYLLAQSDFTQTEPTILNIVESNSSPALNETISITADITNENAVYVGHRFNLYAPFVRIPMYDDGAHNDGAAGDGKYGASITLSTTFVQYYIYAENAGIGKFSPVRAEHEFYTISITTPVAGDVVINELLASNSTNEMDQDGEYEDWIEIYNNTSAPINLSSYYLSDNDTNLTQWPFPNGTILPANGYLVVWADNDILQTGFHANFKLSTGGETIYLLSDATTLADQITFPGQISDISYGRYPNGTGSFASMNPTFSAQNSAGLSINEIPNENKTITIYPNPASDYFQLKMSTTDMQGSEMFVYNSSGQMVFKGEITNHMKVSTTDWKSGLYLVRVGDFQTKLMVQ
ncbi:MAG: CotH kinase family protein [Crocinitomicaceae bacterium]